jgi:RHS repeat-associated protein
MLGEFSAGDKFSLYKGAKRYELTPNGEAQVISAKDYYPFGMSMPSRTTEGGTYRYGFNGKETDQETGIQDYGMRWYLPNIARFPSVDPLTQEYPWYTPYQFAGNMPIQYIDLDGCEPAEPETKWTRKTEYEKQEGRTGEYYSTSDGYYVHKNGDTYNWAKVGDNQWNPDGNWKPTDYIDKKPIGIPEQSTQTKWVDQFHATTNSMKPMLNFAAAYCEFSADICSGGLEGLITRPAIGLGFRVIPSWLNIIKPKIPLLSKVQIAASKGGTALSFPLTSVKSWAANKVSTFGHTFTRHGKKQYKSLIGRLETGNPQGHWLDDNAAASFLESIQTKIDELMPGEAFDFSIPEGLGQVLSKDMTGTIISKPATQVRVVRGSERSKSFIKSAFPIN